MAMAHMRLNHSQFNKYNWQVFININKYKIVLKIRKDYLSIIVFLMATKKPLFLSKFTSMQDLENNNWILLEFT